MPAPVSASPPSWRRPTSTLGVSDSRPPAVYDREPSSPVRSRVTAASVAFRRPAGPSTPSMDVPTHSASALNASTKPLAPSATSSPRVPAAAIFIASPDSSPGLSCGVSSSLPLPWPPTPQTVMRSVAR